MMVISPQGEIFYTPSLRKWILPFPKNELGTRKTLARGDFFTFIRGLKHSSDDWKSADEDPVPCTLYLALRASRRRSTGNALLACTVTDHCHASALGAGVAGVAELLGPVIITLRFFFAGHHLFSAGASCCSDRLSRCRLLFGRCSCT